VQQQSVQQDLVGDKGLVCGYIRSSGDGLVCGYIRPSGDGLVRGYIQPYSGAQNRELFPGYKISSRSFT